MTDTEAIALYRARIDRKWKNDCDSERKSLANEIRKVLAADSDEDAHAYLNKQCWLDPLYCAKALRRTSKKGTPCKKSS